MNIEKLSKKFAIAYKDSKMWILSVILETNDKVGEIPTRLVILLGSFAVSTLLSVLMFGISGILRYKDIIPIMFALSNTCLTYYISRPYVRLLSGVLDD